MNQQLIKKVCFTLLFTGSSLYMLAQNPKNKTIDITSTFKPVLREASKINLNTTPPPVDSSMPQLNYRIPVENLVFSYQAAELQPVALQIDSLQSWQYSNFIKVGIGNVHQPYLKAGFSFGDNKNTFFNIFANHYTAKGDLDFQKNGLTSVGATATYKTPKNLEWNAGVGFKSEDYYLYGYPDTLTFTKDELRQRFQTIEGKIHFRNLMETEFGLNYHPSLQVSSFTDNHDPDKGSETNTILDLPLEKTFGEKVSFLLGATANLTNLKTGASGTKETFTNNLYYVTTALKLRFPNVQINAGIQPSWDQRQFKILPEVSAVINTSDQRLTLQLGWIGYYEKGSYQRFASINPWLAQPDSLQNTRVTERYAGIKGSVGDHFSFSAKASLLKYNNMPLFVNDFDDDGKTFLIRYEPRLNVVQVHSEVGYQVGEQFGATAGINLRYFSRLTQESEAWGLIPMELNAGLRWQLMKDLWFNSNLWAFNGPRFVDKDGGDFKGDTGLDLSAGAEFRITKNFNLWVQLNNIFNNRYERWNQYKVYGFNILGGITYSFAGK